MTILILLLALLFPTCQAEDSVGCYWDASTAGNGTGTSFLALSEGVIIYLP